MRYTRRMPSFSYIARTASGTMEKGSVTATNAEAAREKLRKQQLMVEELKQNSAEEDMETIGFSGAMPWTTTEDDLAAVPPPSPKTAEIKGDYVPLVDTLQLFAGWLLAWYGVVYALGALRLSGKLGFDIPFLESLFESPLVLRFAFGTFLFLLLSNVHQWLGRGAGKAIGLGALWLLLLLAFSVNA